MFAQISAFLTMFSQNINADFGKTTDIAIWKC